MYLHEVVAWTKVVVNKDHDWSRAAADMDWGRIDGWIMNAKRRGKKVIWSEPSYAWQRLAADSTGRKMLAKWGSTLVPMFATNWETTTLHEMVHARDGASRVARAHGLELGESVQSWHFLEQKLPATAGATLALCEYGYGAGSTFYQFEGSDLDMRPESPYIEGAAGFCAKLRDR